MVSERQQLLNGAVRHFQDIFTASPYELQEELFEEHPATITNDMNRSIEALPTTKEVLEGIKSLYPDSAPGPDGFTGISLAGVWNNSGRYDGDDMWVLFGRSSASCYKINPSNFDPKSGEP